MILPIDAVLPDLLAALREHAARCSSRRPARARRRGSRRHCSASRGAAARSCCSFPAASPRAPPPNIWPGARRGARGNDRLCHPPRQQGRQGDPPHRHDPRRVPVAHPGRSRTWRRLGGAVRRGPRAQPRQRPCAGAWRSTPPAALRPDLRILAMSATLDGERFGGCSGKPAADRKRGQELSADDRPRRPRSAAADRAADGRAIRRALGRA